MLLCLAGHCGRAERLGCLEIPDLSFPVPFHTHMLVSAISKQDNAFGMLTDLVPLRSPLLELSNYHILGRIFYYVPYFSLPAGKILSTFGGLMAPVETLNSLGIALSANLSSSHSQQKMEDNLTVAALSIQLAVIFNFVLLAAMFHRRCARANVHVKAV